jgi:hypothetical protein
LQVDLFFYREPEEAKEQEEDDVPAPDYAIADFNAAVPSDGRLIFIFPSSICNLLRMNHIYNSLHLLLSSVYFINKL